MKTHTLTLSLALLYALLPAQAPLRLSPPFSLGGYTVSAENACALAANPSALAFQRSPVFLSIVRQQALALPSSVFLSGCGLPFGERNAFGMFVLQERWADFRETGAAVSFAQSYAQRFAMALQLSCRSLAYSDAYYGRKFGMDVSLSTFYRPQAPWRFGLVWDNPFGLPFWVGGAQRERIPSAVGAGGSYHWSARWTTCFEYRKTSDGPATLYVGLEARPHKRMQGWAGFEIPYAKADFGVACALPFGYCGMACAFHPLTGPSLALFVSGPQPAAKGGRKE
ncbi:MAG: hypothetical protein J5873_01660 [Bacteroidales bacterium]|nr:hypothetical protein [Bacteroidales bacterium]